MENLTDLPDSEVIVKISSCNICKGIVRTTIKHWMSDQSKKEFMKEVTKYDLSVNDMPLLEFRENKQKWCNCKK